MARAIFNFDNSYQKLPEELFSRVKPTAVSNPQIVIFNKELAVDLDLKLEFTDEEILRAVLSGNMLPKGSIPIAQAYAGHQFGNFTMLGDGRAILLGEHLTHRQQRYDIQLKGCGRTPYSRRADGRAALGPMLREYLISEAMHHLGIPTTRSLAVVTTGESIMRETMLRGAVLTRVASSHIRVGTFEYVASCRDTSLLRELLNYTIKRHFSDIQEHKNPTLAFLKVVMEKQADLIAHWMRVGFIHGVMNTDNMAISGETIDYGPCAFIDSYSPDKVFSSIDHQGRYAFAMQPKIAQWNLARLAEALLPLISDNIDEAVLLAEDCVKDFEQLFQEKWLRMMRYKLGFTTQQPEDLRLINELLEWMHKYNADYTNTFIRLSKLQPPDHESWGHEEMQVWFDKWLKRLKQENNLNYSQQLMANNNPLVIPRNHDVERVLYAAEHGDISQFQQMLQVLKNPFHEVENTSLYQQPPEPHEIVYQTFCGT